MLCAVPSYREGLTRGDIARELWNRLEDQRDHEARRLFHAINQTCAVSKFRREGSSMSVVVDAGNVCVCVCVCVCVFVYARASVFVSVRACVC